MHFVETVQVCAELGSSRNNTIGEGDTLLNILSRYPTSQSKPLYTPTHIFQIR